MKVLRDTAGNCGESGRPVTSKISEILV